MLTTLRTYQLVPRYEHSKLSDERIAELVRESLAAVGLKVCVDEAYFKVGTSKGFFQGSVSCFTYNISAFT